MFKVNQVYSTSLSNIGSVKIASKTNITTGGVVNIEWYFTDEKLLSGHDRINITYIGDGLFSIDNKKSILNTIAPYNKSEEFEDIHSERLNIKKYLSTSFYEDANMMLEHPLVLKDLLDIKEETKFPVEDELSINLLKDLYKEIIKTEYDQILEIDREQANLENIKRSYVKKREYML